MIKLIGLLVVCFLISPILRADKRKLEDYISKKEILSQIKTFRKQLPKKSGYKNSKIWDTLLEYVAEKEDKILFKTMLSQLQYTPPRKSEYRRDLFKILEKNSSFFLREFDKHFNGNQFCLTWFFDRKKYEVQDLDFTKFKGSRFAKLNEQKSVSSKESKTCKKAHSKMIKELR
ncbi:MAG: hypothetical protein CME70_13570 [Halobacteriovorax sp.]|nr:hypothetical protein [Halobacteriovorax sp.]